MSEPTDRDTQAAISLDSLEKTNMPDNYGHQSQYEYESRDELIGNQIEKVEEISNNSERFRVYSAEDDDFQLKVVYLSKDEISNAAISDSDDELPPLDMASGRFTRDVEKDVSQEKAGMDGNQSPIIESRNTIDGE